MASNVIRRGWFSWPTTAKNVVLPNVVGLKEEEALLGIGCQTVGARTTAYSTGVINKGRVISTNPAAGNTQPAKSVTVSYIVSDGFNVTFTDVGDVVTAPAAHGIANGDIVYFPVITTTTGIAVNTPYYAVGVTATTFQLALTPGGAPIALTTNGTGSVVRGNLGGPYA